MTDQIAGDAKAPFNPNQHMSTLRNGGKYLPVAARVAWFRHDHPNGFIDIDPHLVNETVAIFRARVAVEEGGFAVGYGSCTPQQFADGYVEKAGTKALGRALAAMGYSTIDTDDLNDDGAMADAPVGGRQYDEDTPPWQNQPNNSGTNYQPPQQNAPQGNYQQQPPRQMNPQQQGGNQGGGNQNDPNRMTPGQFGKIKGIARDRGITDDQFNGWFQHTTNLTWPNISKQQATGTIEMLLAESDTSVPF